MCYVLCECHNGCLLYTPTIDNEYLRSCSGDIEEILAEMFFSRGVQGLSLALDRKRINK